MAIGKCPIHRKYNPCARCAAEKAAADQPVRVTQTRQVQVTSKRTGKTTTQNRTVTVKGPSFMRNGNEWCNACSCLWRDGKCTSSTCSTNRRK